MATTGDDGPNPAESDVAGSAGQGEPPVGRGSVRRFERRADGPRGEAIPRPSWTRRSRRGLSSRVGSPGPRARLGFGCAVAAILAITWVWVGRGATSDPVPVAPTTVATQPRPRVEPVVVSVPRWVPRAIASTCTARRSATTGVVTVDCVPGRGVITLQYRGFSAIAELRTAYAATASVVGGAGSPGCKRGTREERSWSVQASPTVPSGRYECSLVGGRARLVWTSEHDRVLAIASRDDRDLRSLFEWWSAVPGPGGN